MFGHNQFNWTQIQHLMAEGDYGWRQTGNKGLTYAAKDPDCLNQFKSNMEILGPDGVPIKVSENVSSDDGVVPTWQNIPKGSKIKWSAKTLADDEEPASDRIQVELTWMDSKYIAKVVSDVIENLTDEEQNMLLTETAEITKIITDRTMDKLDFGLLMKTIYSTVRDTNDNGYYEGEIPIASQWPTGSYSMMIHYGYHAQSESADTTKAFEFWVMEMGTLIVELIVVALVSIFCPPCGLAVGVAIFTVFIIADIAIMYSQYQKDAFGMTGLNKYDCAFPDGGWNHLYAFGYDIEEAEQEIGDQASPTTVSILQQQSELYIEQNGILAATLVGTMGIGVLLILVTRIKQKARRKKDGS